jgi:hypothetical protein
MVQNRERQPHNQLKGFSWEKRETRNYEGGEAMMASEFFYLR